VSLLDLIVLAILGLSIATGFMAGFARVGIGFIAAVLGVGFGFWFYGIPAGWVHQYIHSVLVSNLIGFLLVFWAFLLAGALLGKLVSKLFKWTGLSWLDRLMGGVFGLVRGTLMVVALIAVLMAFTPKPMPNWMVDSKLLPYAVDTSNVLAALAPNAIKDAFRDSMRDLRKIWDDQLRKSREELESLKPGSQKPEAQKPEFKKKEKSR
jgi:membrane protein required for colicin V production